MTTTKIAPGLYRHYKGGLYDLVDVAGLSEDISVDMVVYRSRKSGDLWCRPLRAAAPDLLGEGGPFLPTLARRARVASSAWTDQVEWFDGVQRGRFVLACDAPRLPVWDVPSALTKAERDRIATGTLTANDLRALGWSVAVHNDYRFGGVQHTFWLFTKQSLAAKGEGRTDAEALARALEEIRRLEPPTCGHPLVSYVRPGQGRCDTCTVLVPLDEEVDCPACPNLGDAGRGCGTCHGSGRVPR